MTQQPPAAPTLHPKRCDHFDVCYVVQTSGICAYERFGVCASHSTTPDADARRRIADMVKELEARKAKDETERLKVRGWPGSHQLFGYISYDEAIALLKEGGEK